jgi:hypothetical protein
MTRDTARKAMGAAAAVVALGCVLPWASVFVVSVSGTDLDEGKVALGAAVVGGLMLLLDRAWWLQLVAPLTCGSCAVGYALWVTNRGPEGLGFQPHVRVGAGIYLVVAASLAWLIVAVASRREVRHRAPTGVLAS